MVAVAPTTEASIAKLPDGVTVVLSSFVSFCLLLYYSPMIFDIFPKKPEFVLTFANIRDIMGNIVFNYSHINFIDIAGKIKI